MPPYNGKIWLQSQFLAIFIGSPEPEQQSRVSLPLAIAASDRTPDSAILYGRLEKGNQNDGIRLTCRVVYLTRLNLYSLSSSASRDDISPLLPTDDELNILCG